MKLSIIVPVYNMARSIHEENAKHFSGLTDETQLHYCINSLLAQTLPAGEFEILPVDDASADDSPAILRDYAQRFPERVKPIFSKENRRQGGAKNLGLDAATGEWVGFVDSDDWVHPEMYARLLAKAEATGADVAGCQYSITSEHSLEIGRTVQVHDAAQSGDLGEARKRLLVLKPGSMVVNIYRRSVIERYHLRFPERTFYEDNQAAPLWMLRFTHFALVDEPLYYYYQREDSTVHSVTMSRLRDRMRTAESLISECKRLGFYEPYQAELETNFTRIYYVNTLFSYMQAICGEGVRADDGPADASGFFGEALTRRTDYALLRELRDGILAAFPDFRANPAYATSYDAEQRRLIDLHLKSVRRFAAYYRTLQAYRRVRYGESSFS